MFINSINIFRFCWLTAPIQISATEMLFGTGPQASGESGWRGWRRDSAHEAANRRKEARERRATVDFRGPFSRACVF